MDIEFWRPSWIFMNHTLIGLYCMKRLDVATVAMFNTQKVATVAKFNTQNVATLFFCVLLPIC